MAGVEELDLTKPGKIWAIPEYESTTTFYMVVPNENNTKAKLIASAQPPSDQLMPPFPVAHTALDKDGKAVFDLQKSGRAKNIMDQLEAKLNANQPIHNIRAVIMADMAPGNHQPDKVAVETIDFSVAAFPIITLNGKVVKATAQQVKSGQVREFQAEFRATLPMKEVKVSISPEVDIEVNGQKGKGSITIPVKEGQAYPVKVPITINKGKINLLNQAQKNDWNTMANNHPHGLGNLVSKQGATLTDPMASVDKALIKDGGLFDVVINQKLVVVNPQYRTYYNGGWRLGSGWGWSGQSGSYSFPQYDSYLDVATEETWNKKDLVLKVEGTGPYAGTVKTIPLTLDGWGIAFHVDNLPRVFNHNAC